MEDYLKDDMIVIGPSYMKKDLLKSNKLKNNIKYIDEYELKDKYLYRYKDGVLTYLDNKYNYIPEISKIILDNLYEIDSTKIYNSKKLNRLAEIKKDLINNGYIKNNNFLKEFLNNKNILVIDDLFDSKTNSIIEKLKKNNYVLFYKNNIIYKDSIKIYEFNTMEEEVISVASKIVDLINNGIDIKNIKINKLNDEYKIEVVKIFNFYGIPYNYSSTSLIYLEDTKMFLNKLNDNTKIKDINNILDEISINDLIKEKIVSIFNKYIDYERYYDIKNEIIYELKNCTINLNLYDNDIKEINYKTYLPSDDEYIFMLGINQDFIPIIHKDNNYLSDNELLELNSDTSYDLNNKEKQSFIRFINNTKNIIISYKLSSNFSEYKISNIVKELDNVSIIKEDYKYDNLDINKLLYAANLDNYVKYNEISDTLSKLHKTYENIGYNSYDNKYNGIDINTIKKQLNNKLNLSYTNSNTFFKCKFRFLLDTIYKLSPFEETISQKIGNLFHDVLCIVYKGNNNYDNIINEQVNKYFTNSTKKELFYVEKYKKTLRELIDILNEQLSKTDYKNDYLEEWFSIEKDRDLNFKVLGKIDKVLTLKDDKNTYVIVIDYKTGSMHGDFNKVIYGLDMQLLYYLYLIKNTNIIMNPKFTGMYLQPVMSEKLNSEKNKTYDEIKKDSAKLFGYTIDDVSLISHIDKDYDEKSFIQGLKIKKDGTFYTYSKVLSSDTINELIDIVDKNINEVMDSIENSDFSINPKKLDNDLVGCEYCQFKDICYMNNDNIVELESHKNLDFLGGDNSDTN